MKKALLFLTALILLSMITNAQKSSAKSFDENSRLVNVGIGFGNYYYHTFATGNGITERNPPAISLSYEQPWKERLGPGFLGVGGYVGFKAYSWNDEYSDPYGSYSYKDRYNNFMVCARAMYHWDGLNFEKADIYGGFILGLRIESHHQSDVFTGAYAVSGSNKDQSDLSFGPAYSLVAGARYYFTPKIGVFGELSYGISYLTAGVTFKL